MQVLLNHHRCNTPVSPAPPQQTSCCSCLGGWGATNGGAGHETTTASYRPYADITRTVFLFGFIIAIHHDQNAENATKSTVSIMNAFIHSADRSTTEQETQNSKNQHKRRPPRNSHLPTPAGVFNRRRGFLADPRPRRMSTVPSVLSPTPSSILSTDCCRAL